MSPPTGPIKGAIFLFPDNPRFWGPGPFTGERMKGNQRPARRSPRDFGQSGRARIPLAPPEQG
jgi:hypothetical protein